MPLIQDPVRFSYSLDRPSKGMALQGLTKVIRTIP